MPSSECGVHSTSTTSPASRPPCRFMPPSCAMENSGPEITTPVSSSESCHRANSISRRHRFGCTSKTRQHKLVSLLNRESSLTSNCLLRQPCHSGRRRLYDGYLAQTSDHLSVSRAVGNSHLLPGSGVHRRRRRQLDHTGFPRAHLLDLHHVARHRCPLEFNCRRVICQVRSIADSLLVNGAFRDSARHRIRRLRKAAARRGQPKSIRKL